MKLDVLAFGVHPDDIELSCGGALLVEKKGGKKTGIIDLTQGELGTRGTAETRMDESTQAGLILKVDARENLKMEDGFLLNDESHQRRIVEMIRKYQPEIIFCNATEDRHPDHGRSASLVADSSFLSGLVKIETNSAGERQKPWRPKYVFHYIQDRYLKPDFVLDISDVFEQKIEAVRAYRTQFFNPDVEGPQTYISTPGFIESIVYRAKMFGKLIGVEYAEGFTTAKAIGIKSLDAFILKDT